MKAVMLKLYIVGLPLLMYLLISKGSYAIAAAISIFTVLGLLDVIESKLDVLISAIQSTKPSTDTEIKEGAE